MTEKNRTGAKGWALVTLKTPTGKKTMGKSEWARYLGISRQGFEYRLKNYDKDELILRQGYNPNDKYNSKYTNKYGMTVKKIAEKLNVSPTKVYSLEYNGTLTRVLKRGNNAKRDNNARTKTEER